MAIFPDRKHGSGAGSSLPAAVLILAGFSTLVAVLVSSMSIYLHLKNYRKPVLQRMVVRIMIMVPIYGVSSLIALFSLEAAFVIDVIRDIYEAFVIYCFFHLLLSYLGGERSLLILLHGRAPKQPPFPASLLKQEIDVSDPYTFLFLKRGILQYVQVKPVLAIVTLILKSAGAYNEGNFRANSGYLYVSIIYNTSICLALYCLAMFWLCVNDDLKPFRPVPKFLCVKGILFFSFWQSIGVSLLVAAGAIIKLGPYTDAEHISLGLTDTLITLEMPFFAIAHMYAFSHTDFTSTTHAYVARMPAYYALRDAFGLADVVADSRATLRGEGMDYRTFEPSEGRVHQGAGRERRIRAGLRYSKGGQRKYWLPEFGEREGDGAGRVRRTMERVVGAGEGAGDVHAPLLVEEEEDVVHDAPDLEQGGWAAGVWDSVQDGGAEEGYALPFGDLDEADEALFAQSRRYLFGDYNYPCIDVSSEAARGEMWDQEEQVLRDEMGAWVSPIRIAASRERHGKANGYGAVGVHPRTKGKERGVDADKFGDRDRDRLIDYEQDRTPAEEGDVKLRWTKVRQPSPRSGSRTDSANSNSPRPVMRSTPAASSSSSSPRSNANATVRSPPPRSRTSSQALPPDAVDLVVEDEERSGLRRVYRRGFDIDAGAGGERRAVGEIEVESEGGDEVGSDERTPGSNEERDGMELEDEVLEDVESVVRAETPPLYAQAHNLPEDDNPWA